MSAIRSLMLAAVRSALAQDDSNNPAKHGKSDLRIITHQYHRDSGLTPCDDESSPKGDGFLTKSGSGWRKGARIDRLLVGLTHVQLDEVDQHQPVGRLTIVVLRLGKQGELVG
jgi:hypothetical protein